MPDRRGFVTIATGDERFYRIAENLLSSYRCHTKAPMPFSLICDRHDRCAAGFDQVIIRDDPARSYLDMLRLPEYVPYDETIFIDADSLAYRDLNDFWDAFEGATDFSAFGSDYSTDWPYAWFRKEDVGEFSDRIISIPDFIGGVYFLRKSPELKAFSETCRYVRDHYYDYRFRQFEDPADEPIIALAMAVHGFKTAGVRSLPLCFYPHTTQFEADILSGTMTYNNRFWPDAGLQKDGYLVHWGSGNTRWQVYRFEEYKLRRMAAGRPPGKIEVAAARTWYRTDRALRDVVKRVLRKMKLYK